MGRLLRPHERIDGFPREQKPAAVVPIRGYWISQARIHDRVRHDIFAEAMMDLLDGYGARILVRSDLPALTDDNAVMRVGIVEFDSHFTAVSAWNDPEVRQTMRLFDDTCTFQTQIVAGTGE